MKKSLSVTGVAEIVLSVRDLFGMRDFYMRVFGFKLFSESSHPKGVGFDPGGVPTICFLKMFDLDSPLGRHSHPQVLALIDQARHNSSKLGHDVTQSTLHHLAFEISSENFESQKEILEELELSPAVAEFENISAKSLFFKDPEGNSLELICHHSLEN